MHQITSIEPKWLSEVAPTFFRVADLNKISKRKAAEKIEPLHDRFAADKDDWVSAVFLCRAVLIISDSANKRSPLTTLKRSQVAMVDEVGEGCLQCISASLCDLVLSRAFSEASRLQRKTHLDELFVCHCTDQHLRAPTPFLCGSPTWTADFWVPLIKSLPIEIGSYSQSYVMRYHQIPVDL